jgi:hypothetical protein
LYISIFNNKLTPLSEKIAFELITCIVKDEWTLPDPILSPWFREDGLPTETIVDWVEKSWKECDLGHPLKIFSCPISDVHKYPENNAHTMWLKGHGVKPSQCLYGPVVVMKFTDKQKNEFCRRPMTRIDEENLKLYFQGVLT